MKSNVRNLWTKGTPAPDPAVQLIDAADLDIAPLPVTAAIETPFDPDAAEAADFAERLGDLDQFIGGGGSPISPVRWAGGSLARNLPTGPVPEVPLPTATPISHPRPTTPSVARPSIGAVRATWPLPPDTRPVQPEPVDTDPVDTDTEAQEFLDRLGDLDRFIGGSNQPPTGNPPTI